MRLDTHRDGRHAFPITRPWAEVTSGVDAVFSFSDKLYMIKVGLEVSTQNTLQLKQNFLINFKEIPSQLLLLLFFII